jgi:hypothetical protein
MAKISTYPHPPPPQLGDYIIGTDISDLLMTKNFLLSDIITLATTTGQFVTIVGAQTITATKTFNTSSLLTTDIAIIASSYAGTAVQISNYGGIGVDSTVNSAGGIAVKAKANNSGTALFVDGKFKATIATYANNAAAIAGGLTTDYIYKTSTGELRIVV